jgi:phospholipase C
MRNRAVRISGIAVLAVVSMTLAGCRGLVEEQAPPPPPPPPPATLNSINHIIFMAQENRGFEHYFGALRAYWAAKGYPDQSYDGLPQFNPASGAAPLLGPSPTNPGCDPAFPFDPTTGQFNDCIVDSNSPPVPSFHLTTKCTENPSPFWNESKRDWNVTDPLSATPTLDGYVKAAAHDARTNPGTPFFDTDGLRAMGYYDGSDLPYYYFMASNFGTSDRWFAPVMSRTQPNRMYSLAATSAGHVYPLHGAVVDIPTIFDLLQAANVSWKVYVTDMTYSANHVQDSALNMFTTAQKYPNNIVPVSEFLTDVQNGTLPSVAYIDPGYNSGLDEHPGIDDDVLGPNIQKGAKFVAMLINNLMQSPSWKDSVFILTFDEFGGFYDHVPPQGPGPTVAAATNPDGIPPSDLQTNDFCVPPETGATCDFNFTGYRVPLVVISPFSKKNFVSHTVADETAWLKLVETRFNTASLTNRDAAQMDMTEFFDFTNTPWATPPDASSIPDQPVVGPCYFDHLP